MTHLAAYTHIMSLLPMVGNLIEMYEVLKVCFFIQHESVTFSLHFFQTDSSKVRLLYLHNHCFIMAVQLTQ
jgi:hypothetical protein